MEQLGVALLLYTLLRYHNVALSNFTLIFPLPNLEISLLVCFLLNKASWRFNGLNLNKIHMMMLSKLSNYSLATCWHFTFPTFLGQPCYDLPDAWNVQSRRKHQCANTHEDAEDHANCFCSKEGTCTTKIQCTLHCLWICNEQNWFLHHHKLIRGKLYLPRYF